MPEKQSENQEARLEDIIRRGEALCYTVNLPGALVAGSYGSSELPSQISMFLCELAGAIPANYEPEGSGRMTELVYRLTSIRRKAGEMLLSYVMRAIAERSRSRIFGLNRGEVLSSNQVVVRPAFGAPMPKGRALYRSRVFNA